MPRAIPTLLCLMALCCTAGDEDPISISTFELKDGRKIEATRVSSIEISGKKNYSLYTLDGKRVIVNDYDIVSRKDSVIPFEKLSEDARLQVQKSRAEAAAAKAFADAQVAAKKDLEAAKRKEADLRAALKRAGEELGRSNAEIVKAETFIKNIPVEVAKMDAEYDAAKTELSAVVSCPNCTQNIPCPSHQHNADFLRGLMKAAAEDKAKLDGLKKDAEKTIAQNQEFIKPLITRLETVQNDLADAQAETRFAQVKADNVRMPGTEPVVAPKGPVTVYTLKNGSAIRGTGFVENKQTNSLVIKDEQGRLHVVQREDIVKSEPAKPAAEPNAK